MKIRFKGNSVRMRLNQTEVKEILDGKTVVEKTEFPGAVLQFELCAIAGLGQKFQAALSGHCMRISMNGAMARQWTDGDCVGFSGDVLLTGGDILRVLIEKDFACLDRSADEEPDAFINPKTCAPKI